MGERAGWAQLRHRRMTEPGAAAAYDAAKLAFDLGRAVRELREHSPAGFESGHRRLGHFGRVGELCLDPLADSSTSRRAERSRTGKVAPWLPPREPTAVCSVCARQSRHGLALLGSERHADGIELGQYRMF